MTMTIPLVIILMMLSGAAMGDGGLYLVLKWRIEPHLHAYQILLGEHRELQAKYERLTDHDPKTGRFWKGPGA